MNKIFSKNFLKNIILFLTIYLFLYGSFYLFSNGLQPRTLGLEGRRFVVCALVLTLAIKLWFNSKLSLKELALPIGIFMAWCLVYPVAYWMAYHGSQSFFDNHFDHVFGCYSLAAFIGLKVLLKKYASARITTIICTLVQIFLLAIPIFQIGYYALYQLPVTEAGFLAILQTNPAEAKEFVMQNFGYAGIVFVVLLLLFIVFLIYMHNKKFAGVGVHLQGKSLAFAGVLFVATSVYSVKVFPEIGILDCYDMAKFYFKNAKIFNENHDKNFASLEVNPSNPSFSKPSTIIMIIGESVSPEYMSAYNKNTEVDSTPWLRGMMESKEIRKVGHAYTSWNQTVPALERALTEKNQYNDKEFNDSNTIIDLAKKAGYKTYWFSAQGYISGADTPITLVAQTADKKVWLCDKYFNTDKMVYDGDLLPLLDEVNPKENNFIVFHVMGSHDDTINRYPPEKARFAKPGKFDTVANYFDSLAYIDDFMRDVYNYGRD